MHKISFLSGSFLLEYRHPTDAETWSLEAGIRYASHKQTFAPELPSFLEYRGKLVNKDLFISEILLRYMFEDFDGRIEGGTRSFHFLAACQLPPAYPRIRCSRDVRV